MVNSLWNVHSEHGEIHSVNIICYLMFTKTNVQVIYSWLFDVHNSVTLFCLIMSQENLDLIYSSDSDEYSLLYIPRGVKERLLRPQPKNRKTIA
jgi:hypothetical protein